MKAIIIGASSGIGRELAKQFSQHGYTLGLTARRIELLESLQEELPHPSYLKKMDVREPEAAQKQLQELIEEMNGASIIVVNAGINHLDLDLDWGKSADTIETNVSGFVALSNTAMHYFIAQNKGHLVGITSLAALRGSDTSPAYYASKAFQSNYLQGLRKKVAKLKLPITVTEIQPGPVATDMLRGNYLVFAAPADKAARQIYRAIVRRKKLAYITKRWRLVAYLMKTLPDFIFNRI